jgi:hypothetical protein
MESAGSVSDFEDEQATIFEEYEEASPISRRLHAHEFDHRLQKRATSWPIWAAAAVVILGMLGWWFGSGTGSKEVLSAKPPIPLPPTKVEVSTKQVLLPQEESTVTAIAPVAIAPTNVVPKESEPPMDKSKITGASVAATSVINNAKKPIEAPSAVAPKVDAPKVEAPKTMVSTPPAPAQTKPNPPPTSAPPMAPPAPVTVPNPVIIRKAIMPSAEEIAKFKQGQVTPKPSPQPVQVTPTAPNQSNGSSPVIKLTGQVSDSSFKAQ